MDIRKLFRFTDQSLSILRILGVRSMIVPFRVHSMVAVTKNDPRERAHLKLTIFDARCASRCVPAVAKTIIQLLVDLGWRQRTKKSSSLQRMS